MLNGKLTAEGGGGNWPPVPSPWIRPSTWLGVGLALCTVHANVKEKETRQDLYNPLFLPLAPSAVVCLDVSSDISSTWLLVDLIQDVAGKLFGQRSLRIW